MKVKIHYRKDCSNNAVFPFHAKDEISGIERCSDYSFEYARKYVIDALELMKKVSTMEIPPPEEFEI